MSKLKFNLQIAATAASSISVNELLKRLKALADELESLDQENVDRSSLVKVAAQLVSPNVLHHKNKGVTAYASCCIADLLRLCAPDAPFSQPQLRSIFECFIKQFKGLEDVEGTYYQQHFYLLESLATVESVVLLGDIEKSDRLIEDIIRTFFDVAKGDQSRPALEEHVVNIMTQLIDELPQLPADVLDILLAQLMRSDNNNNNKHGFSKQQSAYTVAKAVFNNCADRLQRNICQYFTDIIYDANRETEDDENEATDDERLKITHDLVYELFTSAPTTLQNVIPQLEGELNVDNTICRILATRTISAMLASVNGSLLLQDYPSAYKAWASRRNDKAASIRIAWIQGIGHIMSSEEGAVKSPIVEKLCLDGLVTKLVDSDDKVRSAACEVMDSFPYLVTKTRLNTDVLKTYADRCRDKKPSAQEAAFRHIGKIFDSAYGEIAIGDITATEKFGPLINHILHCVYVNNAHINILLEKTLYDDVLKCSELEDGARVVRILHVLHLADERSKRAFYSVVGTMQKLQAQYLALFLQCCDKFNGGTIKEHRSTVEARLNSCISALSQRFPEPSQAESALRTFVEHNDRRLYRLLADCISPENDYKSVRKAYRDSLKRVGQISTPVKDVMETILRRASLQVFNRSNVLYLDSHEDIPDNLKIIAQSFLGEISVIQPSVYKAHIVPMAAQIREDPTAIPLDTMRALAAFARKYPDDVPSDQNFSNALDTVLLQGDPKIVKQAVTVVCNMKNRSSANTAVVKQVLDGLQIGADNLLSSLSLIAQFNLLAPSHTDIHANEIASFCAKELLMKNHAMKTEDETMTWIDDEALSSVECLAKCFAVRILGNRLRYYHDSKTASDLAKPVFKALRSIILNMGELSKAEDTPLYIRARLRLDAAKMMLKLATLPAYEQIITPEDFIQIALFAQDLEYHVRHAFLRRLQKSLKSQQMAPRWHVIMFLAAHDPEEQIRNETKSRAIQFAHQYGKQGFLMESMMPRLVHLLAHHPDFSAEDRDQEDLVNFAMYFNYYFDSVVTAENLVLVYHYCQRIKQVADDVPQDASNADNIYILSDIAQIVLTTRAEQNNWPLLAYPKKLKLPTDLYRAQLSTESANDKQTKSFISLEDAGAIKARLSKHLKPSKQSKAATSNGLSLTPQKRGRSKSRSGKSHRKRKISNEPTVLGGARRASGRNKKVIDYSAGHDSEASETDLSQLSESDSDSVSTLN